MKKSILVLFILIFSAFNAHSQLVWSTYLGGNNSEESFGIKVDTANNPIITGCSYSSNYPTISGSYQTTIKGVADVLVTKLNQFGNKLLFSTFIGGTNFDVGWDIILDIEGNSYITGSADYDYPKTTGSFNTKNFGGSFVTKLNFRGNGLFYSTMIGEGGAYKISVDNTGCAFMLGASNSENYPVTPGAYDTNLNSEHEDAVLTKLNSLGSGLIYSTFIGGIGPDWGAGLVLDSSGNAIISGQTGSNDFPTTSGAFNNTNKGWESFLTKFNHEGSSLIFSTFLGEIANDNANSIVIDGKNNIYNSGSTTSSIYPITLGSYDTILNGGKDVILSKLNSFASNLIFSTFIGGSGNDDESNLKIDKNNNSYIVGFTSSKNFPVTNNAYDTNYNGGNFDSFITKIDYLGTLNLYSSYIGGSGADYAFGLDIDKYDEIFISGRTLSDDFPTTNNVFDNSYNNNGDIYVLNIMPCNGTARIKTLYNIYFPKFLCDLHYKDTTIYIKNRGTCSLLLFNTFFSDSNKSKVSILEPKSFPSLVEPNDSIKFIIRLLGNNHTGKDSSILFINNNTFVNPYYINLFYSYDSISNKINNSYSDTIIIDIGNFCPGSGPIDTTITVFNKSSIGTTFKIENNDPNLLIVPQGKVGKKEVTPLSTPKKKKTKKHTP